MSLSEEFPVKLQFQVTFPEAKYAEIAAKSVSVDDDSKAGRVKRTISVTDNVVHVVVSGVDAKTVRVIGGATVDMLQLSTKSMATFV